MHKILIIKNVCVSVRCLSHFQNFGPPWPILMKLCMHKVASLTMSKTRKKNFDFAKNFFRFFDFTNFSNFCRFFSIFRFHTPDPLDWFWWNFVCIMQPLWRCQKREKIFFDFTNFSNFCRIHHFGRWGQKFAKWNFFDFFDFSISLFFPIFVEFLILTVEAKISSKNRKNEIS